jgi:hypothetical protein
MRQQTPLQHIEMATARVRVMADDCRALRRRDVPGRRQVRQRVTVPNNRAMASAGRKLA